MSTAGDKSSSAGNAQPPVAPPATSFPANPAGWYRFCQVDNLRRGPLSKKMLGRDFVAFRTVSGQLGVLDARCSHLGADLGRGVVMGETLQCPFHHWCYDREGRCEKVPGQSDIPTFAQQESFPVVERHGHIFFFNRQASFYPLPFFDEDNPANLTSSQAFSFVADAPWFMVTAQGFDRQHFETVHDRRLLGPPHIHSPHRFVRRIEYHAEIIGESWRDRFLRKVVGDTVHLSVQNWGGTLYLIKAKFPRACSRFLVSFRPLEDGRTHFDVIVYSPRGWSALGLPIRRWLTRGHLLAEAAQVRGTQYRPHRLIAADRDMIECFQWIAALPQQLADVPFDLSTLPRPTIVETVPVITH